jgi:hypothetical protein
MPESAVRFFTLDSPDFTPRLRRKLEKRRDELTSELVSAPAPDYAEYKNRLGKIAGITEAILICLNAEKDDNRG